MPLWKSSSKRAFKHNIRTEVRSGRPVKQSVAIAYSTQRRAAEQNRCGCGTCNASGIGKHLSADAKDFRYIKKEARDIARAVTRLERRDSGMKRNQRNRSGFLRDHGVKPTRWDQEKQMRVPVYDPISRFDGKANKVSLTRIKLDRGGYDRNGRYYGSGAPLWNASDDNGEFGIDFRAPDRATAKKMLLAEIPNIRFYR